MAKKLSVNVFQGDDKVTFVAGAQASSLQRFENLIKALKGNGRAASYTMDVRADATVASGTLTFSSASGAVGGVINGVTITVTAAGGDNNTATLAAAAINASANALIANVVTATAAANVVTVTCDVPGVVGNSITLAASGTGVTASGARLAGATETALLYTF